MMDIRTDPDWTVLKDQDLNDQSFKLAHFHENPFVSLSIPCNANGFHSRQLAPSQCEAIGQAFLRFARTGRLVGDEVIPEVGQDSQEGRFDQDP